MSATITAILNGFKFYLSLSLAYAVSVTIAGYMKAWAAKHPKTAQAMKTGALVGGGMLAGRAVGGMMDGGASSDQAGTTTHSQDIPMKDVPYASDFDKHIRQGGTNAYDAHTPGDVETINQTQTSPNAKDFLSGDSINMSDPDAMSKLSDDEVSQINKARQSAYTAMGNDGEAGELTRQDYIDKAKRQQKFNRPKWYQN